MKSYDLLTVCLGGIGHLNDKKKAFVLSIKKTLARKNEGISNAQHNYLQAIYDEVVSAQYGLERVARPNDFWKRNKKDDV